MQTRKIGHLKKGNLVVIEQIVLNMAELVTQNLNEVKLPPFSSVIG